jgi:hypothetical protein
VCVGGGVGGLGEVFEVGEGPGVAGGVEGEVLCSFVCVCV